MNKHIDVIRKKYRSHGGEQNNKIEDLKVVPELRKLEKKKEKNENLTVFHFVVYFSCSSMKQKRMNFLDQKDEGNSSTVVQEELWRTVDNTAPIERVDRLVHRFEDMGDNERGQGACNENRLYQGQGVSYKIRALKASRTNRIITDLIKKLQEMGGMENKKIKAYILKTSGNFSQIACSPLSLPISATPSSIVK
ncbi:hypothetical protein L2E82_10447 [Cichorium intybus]|uniref:Uncharacterized protein n=1 Tax=Cichorium intybus TaxID=13427 RepID=A0ACB9GBL7_CICIN|nr:hypothetical protein L2E82_10447 [Cichorium intybus]